MPPEGFGTVTLSDGLIARLDELPGESYTATVRMLLAAYKREQSDGSSSEEGIGPVTLEASERNKIAEEVVGRLR